MWNNSGFPGRNLMKWSTFCLEEPNEVPIDSPNADESALLIATYEKAQKFLEFENPVIGKCVGKSVIPFDTAQCVPHLSTNMP